MIIIWRRYGWLVPVLVIFAFVLTQIIVNLMLGDEYYTDNSWPKYVAVTLSSCGIGYLGYFFNFKKRIVIIDEESGNTRKTSSHTLFFIPIEYWAIIIPLIFLYSEYHHFKMEKRDVLYLTSPIVNDYYITDFSKIFDDVEKTYKYGILKVIQVNNEDIDVVISNFVFERNTGPSKDIINKNVDSKDYFLSETISFNKDELLFLKENKAIYRVYR